MESMEGNCYSHSYRLNFHYIRHHVLNSFDFDTVNGHSPASKVVFYWFTKPLVSSRGYPEMGQRDFSTTHEPLAIGQPRHTTDVKINPFIPNFVINILRWVVTGGYTHHVYNLVAPVFWVHSCWSLYPMFWTSHGQCHLFLDQFVESAFNISWNLLLLDIPKL